MLSYTHQRNCSALLFSQPGSLKCPPCITAFLWFHISHDCTRKISSSSFCNLSIKDSNKPLKSWQPVDHFCSEVIIPAQTSCVAPQSHTACNAVLANLLQQWHKTFSNNFHFARFTLVGRISWQALHPSTFNLLGIFKPHKTFHICCPPALLH